MNIPVKRQKTSNDTFNMMPLKNALPPTTQIEKKFNTLQKKIDNLEIIISKNEKNILDLTKEIKKLSEVLIFYIDKKEIQPEIHIKNNNNPEYIS
jgi:hypothetical protein